MLSGWKKHVAGRPQLPTLVKIPTSYQEFQDSRYHTNRLESSLMEGNILANWPSFKMCETEQIMETPYENTLWSWRRTLRPSSLNNLPLLLHANPNSQDKSLLCCCGPLYWHCICQQSVFFPHCRLILARRLMKTQVQVLLRNDRHRKFT